MKNIMLNKIAIDRLSINKKNQLTKGISLIVLVITIIIVIILAGAIILSLSNNNPIESANKATFVSNISNYQSELSLYILSKISQNTGCIDLNEENYKSGKEIKTVIKSITDKDSLKFAIVKGKLVYISKDNQKESDWCKETNVEAGTDPVSNKVYLSTKADFVNIFTEMKKDTNYTVGKVFILNNNLDLQNEEWSTLRGDTNFKGTFDGKGFKIINAYQRNGKGGIFFHNSGIIKNLGLDKSCNIATTTVYDGRYSACGGIVAENLQKGIIEMCWNEANTGSNVGSYPIAGGISQNNDGIIKKCYVLGKVEGNHTGGITGTVSTNGIVEDCYSFTQIGDGLYRGAITGYNHNILQNSYSTCNIAMSYDGHGTTPNQKIINSRYFSPEDKNNQSSVDYLNNGRIGLDAPWVLDTLNVNQGYPVLKGVGLGKVY